MKAKTNDGAMTSAMSVLRQRGEKITVLDAQAETDGMAYSRSFKVDSCYYAEDMEKEASERLENLFRCFRLYHGCVEEMSKCEDELPRNVYDYSKLYATNGTIVSATKLILKVICDYEDYMNCSTFRHRCDVIVNDMMHLATLQIAGTKYSFPSENISPCCNKALRFEELLIENFQKGPSLADLDFQPWKQTDIETMLWIIDECLKY